MRLRAGKSVAIMDKEEQKTRRVLIVEDNVVIRWMYARFLTKLGCEADEVASVAEAKAALQRQEYDLILLDVHLTDGDGSAVIRVARESFSTRNIPVVVISSDESGDLMKSMRAHGANEFLLKPVNFEELASVLRRWLTS